MSAWDKLSMFERADIMKLAVESGVYNLDAIRNGYNKFAEGGSKKKVTNTDEQYFTTMEKVAEDNYQKWGFSNPDEALLHALNDNTYNYRGYYNKYPNGKGNAVDHWPDEFKTVYHPTFSNESIYSGKKSQYNPLGLPGGFWSGDTFIPMAWQLDANEHKYGGDIHIAPSKKGTFTAAASKHDMGVQEFASKILANKEDYSSAMVRKANFARNASKWKHAFGGNLFDGTSQPTQQMQLGSAYWQKQARKPIFTTELAKFNKKKAEEGRQRRNEFKKWAATKGKELVEKSHKDYLTTSNDNTWVENRNPMVRASKPKNPHLTERSVKGAKAHAAWEKEHPVLNTWGTVLGAAPFAVAAYPLAATAGSGIAALGDAAAATSAGQAAIAGLTPLTTAASTSVAGAPLYTWADAGLSSLFGAHGIQTAIDEGGISPTTALEIAPLGRLAKPMLDAGKQGLQYTTKAIDNATRYASPSYDLYRTVNETPTIEWTDAANATPEVTHFYHGSPVRFDAFSADFIGSGEGGSKVMRGINLWPEEKIANAPKFANIKSPDAPLHLGVSNTPLGGELNPTVYDVSGRGLKLYTASPREVKRLSQSDLISQGYDGIQTPNQVTVFPESIGKLSIDKQSSIEDFIMSHPEVERWNPWTTDTQKMQNIIDMSKMSKWTPEQWTAAQDAAIAKGDMAEAQRLRDLHFMTKAPNTFASVNGKPLQLYHGTNNDFNAFDLSKYGSTDGGTFGRGVYTTPIQEYAQLYGKNNMPLYMKLDNPRDYRDYSIGDLMAEKLAFGEDFSTGNGIDGVIGRPSWKGFKGLEEYVSHNPKNIKSSKAVTYDDNEVRIPLGERDNFKLNDIRYGLLPFGVGLTGYGLFNNSEALEER